MIDEAVLINGLRFVRVEAVVRYKTIARRPKDIDHIRLATAAGFGAA